MFIFQIVEQGLLVSEMSGGKPSTPVEWSKGQGSPVQSKGDVLLLDYESYFNLNHRRQIFSKFPFLQEVDLVCSPHEAMGGYIRFQNPVYEGDIQIIDLEYDALYVYYISFSGGLYQWKDRSVTGKKIQVAQLAKDCLNLSSVQILKFKQFLEEDAGDGKRFGQIIQEALVEFERGAKEYNDILAVLDQPEWAHIKLSDLTNFKDQLIEIGGFDSTKPSMMVGWPGTIFNSGIAAVDGLEKVYGVVHVQQNTHQFYPKLQASVDLGVYCYPDFLKVLIFEAKSDYQTYSIPQTIELIDNGMIVLYRGDEPIEVKTKNKMSHVKLKINLDGNQNLLLGVGSETYLLV